ncbi:hypothetical protein ONE63_008544 [Megalurothrips usitatus]|uniref:Uncharacterized protein n=1 Tax=Megalurothrips usitatus TaxID=439358 RepID=A0AAV7XP01_9NEOP|nr:hypothetical protein ONE63_008544 [Megalurothrips usitatus]
MGPAVDSDSETEPEPDRWRWLQAPWTRPRAHSDSGIHLGAALLAAPAAPGRVVNAPPEKRQSIALPGGPDWKDAWTEESCRRNVAELLAQHVLHITSATAPPLAAQVPPLLVEDPPSTAEEEDDDILRVAAVAGGPGPAPRFPSELLNG